MKDVKKTIICLVTDWYPTRENPYKGLFFKEQAFCLEEYFEFIVIHPSIKAVSFLEYCIRVLCNKTFHFTQCNKERNTIEYSLQIFLPFETKVADYIENFKKRKNRSDGIGKNTSEFTKQIKKRTLQRLYKQKLKNRFDILYCVDAQNESYTLQLLSEVSGKPYMVAEHSPFPWPGTCISDVEHGAIERADAFIAISQDKLRQVLLQNIKLRKVFYLGNLIDEEKFTLKPENNSSIKTFIIVAANSYFKNYDLFFEIMEKLRDLTDRPFKVLIVGYAANKGYSRDREGFERRVRQSAIKDITTLVPSVPHDELVEYYHKADAFVMTSIQEGMPVSALEAACCGLPIFSTRCGGVEDYVDERMGKIHDICDTDGFARTLKEYVEGRLNFDPQYIRDSVVKRYGREAFLNYFFNMVEIILKGKDHHLCDI